MGYFRGETQFEQSSLEGAISSLVFEIVEGEGRVHKAARESFLTYMRGLQPGHNRKMLTHIQNVTAQDLLRVLEKYIVPLLDPAQSSCAICCNSAKMDKILQGFKALGRDMSVYSSVEEAFAAAVTA